jgi:hypothetical protein
VTFYQETQQVMEAALDAVTTHYASAGNQDGWGGVFIHHYGQWKVMPAI